MFSTRAFTFLKELRAPDQLPQDVQVLVPYNDAQTLRYVQKFLTRFYQDKRSRIGVFGINPGRLGAGLTGIAFTDPVALREHCGIENTLGSTAELSSEFIYKVIDAYGGSSAFFAEFFLSSLCPLGFTKGTKNYNFYDDAALQSAVMPFIRSTMNEQLKLPLSRDTAVILGTGKIRVVAESLNASEKYFRNLVFLEHPRYIMQYKRRSVPAFVRKYVDTLHSLENAVTHSTQ